MLNETPPTYATIAGVVPMSLALSGAIAGKAWKSATCVKAVVQLMKDSA